MGTDCCETLHEIVKQLPTRDVARMWHSSRLVQVLGHVLLYTRLQSKACSLQGHLGQDEVPMTLKKDESKKAKLEFKYI